MRVYLFRVPASSDLHAYRTGFIDLGTLKGNHLVLRREIFRYRLQRYGPGFPADGDTAWRGTGTRRRGGRLRCAAGADGWFPPGHPSQLGAIGRPLCAFGPGNDGVHGGRGRWLVNGSYNGLVELVIEPPCYIPRQPSTLFLRSKVTSLTISLVDPDGFIAAVEGK